MRPIVLFSFILMMFIYNTSSAQQSVEAVFQTGKIVKNYPRFPQRDAAFIGRVAWSKKLDGGAGWHSHYGYPEVTAQGVYGSLGNAKEFGNIHGASIGIRFTKDYRKNITLTAEASWGGALFNNPFDEKTNPDNVAIGSPFTFLTTADFGLLYHIHQRWSLIGRASILHCSDAHISLPNVGINLPMISAGIRYRFIKKSKQENLADIVTDSIQKPVKQKYKPKLNFRVALGVNEQGTEVGPVNGPNYAIYLASLYIYKHYNPVARWQTGFEGYYNTGTYDFILSQRYYEEKQELRSMSFLYMLGHEYTFGNVTFLTQGGLYLYNRFNRDRYEQIEDPGIRDKLKTLFTARIGLNYYIFNSLKEHNNIFVGWYVKTNFGKADFMEFSVGYTF
jgi:hypothetical protein